MEGLSTEKDNCKERKRIDMFRETNKKPYKPPFFKINLNYFKNFTKFQIS